jgi:hypothetical protein
MSYEALRKPRSEASQTLTVFWSLLWRSMVFFPFAFLRFAFIIALLCGFVWLCTSAITYAIVHEWLLSALCVTGVLAYVAAARFIRRRSLRHVAEHHEAGAGGGSVLL